MQSETEHLADPDFGTQYTHAYSYETPFLRLMELTNNETLFQMSVVYSLYNTQRNILWLYILQNNG